MDRILVTGGDFNMKEAHAKIQNKINDIDKNTLTDSSDYIRNQHFIEGRYKSEYHKSIIKYLLQKKGMTILDVGCYCAQIGLEILGLDPNAKYIGIERSEPAFNIARKRMESCTWCEGRFEIIHGDVFAVCTTQNIKADIVLLTWTPMVEVMNFHEICLPNIDGWQHWVLEYIPTSRSILRKLMIGQISSNYHSYSKLQVGNLSKQYSNVQILFKPRLNQLSRIISIQR